MCCRGQASQLSAGTGRWFWLKSPSHIGMLTCEARPVSRSFFAALFSLLLTCAAAAQNSPRTARIGMLCGVRCTGPGHIILVNELRKLGWIEGGNLTIERREAEGHYERLPDLAAELVRSRP